MNKGTRHGDMAEEDFVIDFNSGNFGDFVESFFEREKNLLAVRVTTHQFSNLSRGLVKPKADAFLVSDVNLHFAGSIARNLLLTEKDLGQFDNRVIANSGISIKRPDSTKYQIHKFTRSSFLTLFGDQYLGAGALIYIDNGFKRVENRQIIEGWDLSVDQFESTMSARTGISVADVAADYKRVQRHCLDEIKRQIITDPRKQDVVFWGRTTFKSPYAAEYTYINGVLGRAKAVDFIVTQGSNRLCDPTVVVKPR